MMVVLFRSSGQRMNQCLKNLHMLALTIVVGQLVTSCVGMTIRSDRSADQCGYKSCNPVKDGMLNIHIVPHTHDDVGWVKTVEQYYDQEVSQILPSVVKRLHNDDAEIGGKKKFIYVEMAFLKRWWQDIDDEQKDIVRELVNAGRLEITLGGWSMVDEATTYYSDIIDQHTLGFEFIRQNFGECGRPRLGWQIDPFGHSREVASLFSQFGFDGTFVGRVDYQDKEHRQRTKTMEFMWRTSDSLDTDFGIFTGVLANVYWPPKGFCWDRFCHDEQIVYANEEGKQRMVNEFVAMMENWANDFDTDHLMVEMGSDFHYIDADKWFDNLDELIKLTNQKQEGDTKSKINLLYSTPSCYLYRINQANRTWTTKTDDFFPYAHRPHAFWTGYFTSRPNFKLLVRKAGAFLQGCKQLAALSMLEHSELDLAYLKEAMAVVQHHDGVSGTEKQYVVEDYTRLLMDGLSYCEQVVQKAYSRLLPITPGVQGPDLQFCLDLDIAECKLTQHSDQFAVIFYNPLAQGYTYYVRIPVQDQEYTVTNQLGDLIEHQTLPISEQTIKIPRRFSRERGVELVFKMELPPMGYVTAIVNKYESAFSLFDETLLEEELVELIEEDIGPEPFVPTEEIIENQFYSVSIDRKSGQISRLWNKADDVAVSLDQTFHFYIGYPGYNWRSEDQASGAYIFRPIKNTPTKVNVQPVHFVTYKGSQVQEIRQEFSEWVSQVIRIYDDKPYVELEWTVGPIPSKPYTTSLASNTKEQVMVTTIDALKAEQVWTPYMDVLDENEALSDPPLNDVKNGLAIKFSKVYLQERKQRYEVGDTIKVRIDLYNGYGNRRTRGGDQLRVRIFEESLNAFASGYIIDHKNGSYTGELKCLWAGRPTVLVHVAYPREGVRALYGIRQRLPSTRDTYVTYENNATGRCHAFKEKLNQSKGVCDMTSTNGNMSWYCEAPGTTSTCPPIHHFFLIVAPYPALGITSAEEKMFLMHGEHLNPPINIVVKEKSALRIAPRKPKCTDYDRTKLWFQASPIGHYMHNVWEPEHCQMTPVDKFRGCLKNKHLLLYGDSTIRQWFASLMDSLYCKLTSEAWTKEKWKKTSAAFCPQINLTIEWIVHEFPGNIDPSRTKINSVSGNMLKFAENKDAIFVIHFLCHLSAYHHDVFRDRIAHVRKSAEAILKVNKDAKILIKGGHTFHDRRQISDYYTYVYRTIMIEEFKGLYDKVVYLDNKDLTAAKNVIPNHPDNVVVTQMVNQMMSYICK